MGSDGERRLKRLDSFRLHELESVRLILRGDSVIDWHRLNLETEEDAAELLRAHEFEPDDPVDRARLEHLRDEAVSYLRRQFDFPIPGPVERASVEALLMLASSQGHRQTCACAILKAMHIIHHLDGRELLFGVPMSDQDVFQLVEEKVYRVVGGMLASGLPIVAFLGGRKNRDSLFTKLLSKRDTSAAQIYDKLRFRIVTRGREDVLPVLLHFTRHLFPFSLVVPGESTNSLLQWKDELASVPGGRSLTREFQGSADSEAAGGDNRFSAQSYRVLHFVVDLPIRLPREVLQRAPMSTSELGNIVFVLCEFQMVDQQTELANERGEASHDRYKERQLHAVKRRLKIGSRALRSPWTSTRASDRPQASSRKKG